eukprot:1682347-Amphidinium_carterae.2
MEHFHKPKKRQCSKLNTMALKTMRVSVADDRSRHQRNTKTTLRLSFRPAQRRWTSMGEVSRPDE